MNEDRGQHGVAEQHEYSVRMSNLSALNIVFVCRIYVLENINVLMKCCLTKSFKSVF